MADQGKAAVAGLSALAWALTAMAAVGTGLWYAVDRYEMSKKRDQDAASLARKHELEAQERALRGPTIIGRYQIVSPAPLLGPRGTYLLDTTTGDSWVRCEGEGTVAGWCVLPAWTSTSVAAHGK